MHLKFFSSTRKTCLLCQDPMYTNLIRKARSLNVLYVFTCPIFSQALRVGQLRETQLEMWPDQWCNVFPEPQDIAQCLEVGSFDTPPFYSKFYKQLKHSGRQVNKTGITDWSSCYRKIQRCSNQISLKKPLENAYGICEMCMRYGLGLPIII